MSRRLSIAFLSHLASPIAPTGAERSLVLLACELRRRGHRIAVVAPGPWALEEPLRRADVPVTTIRSRASWITYYRPRAWPLALVKWIRGVWPQRAVSDIGRFLEQFRPDVVHVNCLPHLAGASAASAGGRAVVWHLREILPPGRRRRWLAHRLARHATRVVAVSEAVGRWVREENLGSRLEVIPNGVPAQEGGLDPGIARRELAIPKDGVLFGLYGQLLPHKGALEFVAAAGRALEAEPGLRFALAGDGPASFRARVRTAISANVAADRFHLLEARPSGERLIAAADGICLTTTTPDPFPRAVLEGMGAGKPVVAFDSGGTGEMVLDGETGYLVPTGDVAALGRALVRLARDPRGRRAMGQAGATRVREHFSLDRHTDRMETLFRSLAQ